MTPSSLTFETLFTSTYWHTMEEYYHLYSDWLYLNGFAEMKPWLEVYSLAKNCYTQSIEIMYLNIKWIPLVAMHNEQRNLIIRSIP